MTELYFLMMDTIEDIQEKITDLKRMLEDAYGEDETNV